MGKRKPHWIMTAGELSPWDIGTIVVKLADVSDDVFIGVGTRKGVLHIGETDYGCVDYEQIERVDREFMFSER